MYWFHDSWATRRFRPLLREVDHLHHALEKEPTDEEYDLLIVGGGSSGAGIALDATSRGLKVALVEKDDFSAGR
jgi:heterodisulfide reductase subunit A-like polyferredoxin